MIIKKFTGKTEAEATEAAKKELGSTLVIMNVREVKKKGLFAFLLPKQIEVTAALEEEAPARPQYGSILRTAADKEIRTEQQNLLAKNSTENIEKKLDSLQTLLESQLNNRQSEKEESAKTQDVPDAEEKEDKIQDMAVAEKKEEEKNPEQDKFIRLLYNKMLDNEMDEKYVNSILEDASKTKKADLPFDYLLANIYQKMVLKFGKSEGITPSEEGPRIVLFIGPTGVGKTTTIAKLAGRYCVEEKKKVALLTADTYRIAAAEQLRTYANILETPFRIIYTPEELQAAVDDYWDCDYIFIDTAGRSHQNTDQLEKMKEMVAALKRPESYQVFLVLSATTKYRDLQKIADCYGRIADFELIFTKLDETEAVGNLLNMKLYTDAPIAYVTCGQNVPDDMEAFNPQKTVKQILGGKE
ncbi:flagellar biosynthesis protein FlhF [Lachnospiraceae bacterium CLA-AA-H183]